MILVFVFSLLVRKILVPFVKKKNMVKKIIPVNIYNIFLKCIISIFSSVPFFSYDIMNPSILYSGVIFLKFLFSQIMVHK